MARRRQEFHFVIDAFTPTTIPMARLAEYMTDLAIFLGEKPSVHFARLEESSTAVVAEVEWEAVPKVTNRITAVRHKDGPPDAEKAFSAINRRLIQDNGCGVLLEPGGTTLIEFPGCKQPAEPEFGPFNQPDHLDGIPIVIGGKGDPVPVHLQDGVTIHLCEAHWSIAKELATYLFSSNVRVFGTGRWLRDPTGAWVLKIFRISSFRPLSGHPLKEVVATLREVEADWKSRPDPIRDLLHLRKDRPEEQ